MIRFGQIFAQAKHGERAESCQDLAWFDPQLDAQGHMGFAAADGATSGADSQLWAELVVGFASRRLADLLTMSPATWSSIRLKPELDAARHVWTEIQSHRSEGDSMFDHAWREKVASIGGACTLVAGTVSPTGLRGVVVGDTAVFVVRKPHYELAAVAGPQSLADFGSTPDLIRSVPDTIGMLDATIRTIDIRLHPDDVVLVCTDALAEWAMRCNEVALPVWRVLSGLDHAQFAQLVGELHRSAEIETDDTLLMRLAPGEVRA